MPAASDQLLHDIAARVARRVASGESSALPPRYLLVALSGCGAGLEHELDRAAAHGTPIVAIADCPTGSSAALAAAMARLPGLIVVSGEGAYDTERLVAGAERAVAPSLDLALASRVASMQTDTPASRALLRALLAGVPVEASLDGREFAVSSDAPAGARAAVEGLVSRVRALGVHVTGSTAAPASRAVAAGVAAAAASHPSQERFAPAEPLDEFVEFLETRPCSIEVGKPCVSCGVCEARGF
jgi:hypothetical protein